MTALAESGLRILGNPNDPEGLIYDNEGIGTDHDSLGLFQQRPGWGTAAQRMDPVESTNLFLDQLLALPRWDQADPWVVSSAGAALGIHRRTERSQPLVVGRGWQLPRPARIRHGHHDEHHRRRPAARLRRRRAASAPRMPEP